MNPLSPGNPEVIGMTNNPTQLRARAQNLHSPFLEVFLSFVEVDCLRVETTGDNMYSKAKIKGHPIHPKLVAFPITFYTLTPIAFAVYSFFSSEIFWYKLAYFCNFAGVLCALAAAVPGFIDWAFGIPKESAAKKRGLIHMSLNVSALVLFAINAFRIYGSWNNPVSDIQTLLTLSVVGFGLTVVAGYQGWEMIATHKLGVNLTPEQERLEPIEKMDRRSHKIDARPSTV